MTERLITIKEVKLNNNCPECYNTNGLHLTFKQKFKENHLYRSITSETTQEIECKTCNTMIYPVMWTEDIERVFNYQKKAFVPKKATTQLKKRAWLLIGLFLALVISGVVFAFVLNYR